MANENNNNNIDFKQELTLTLTLEEINVLIRSLSDRPFKDVYELIGKINIQSNKQLQHMQGFNTNNKES